MKPKTVFMLCNQPWQWHSDYCRQTALVLSKTKHVFCYLSVEYIGWRDAVLGRKRVVKRIGRNLALFYPVRCIPFQRFALMRAVEKRVNVWFALCMLYLCGWWERGHIVLWAFDYFVADLVSYVPHTFFVLYDCVDYAWAPDARLAAQFQAEENKLIGSSDTMVVDSHTLYQLHLHKRADIIMVPKGFKQQAFDRYTQAASASTSRARPVIGFIGTIDYRLDFDLLISVAKRSPQWTFEFIGDIHTEYFFHSLHGRKLQELLALSNVIHKPAVADNTIPSEIAAFDIGMIPYNTQIAFNRYCFPLKVFEYLYMGKPVIATPIEELKRYPLYIRIGESADDWTKLIQHALATPYPLHKIRRMRKIAEAHSWRRKIEAIYTALATHKPVYPLDDRRRWSS